MHSKITPLKLGTLFQLVPNIVVSCVFPEIWNKEVYMHLVWTQNETAGLLIYCDYYHRVAVFSGDCLSN